LFQIEQRFIALEKLVVAASTKGLDEQHASYLCRLGSVLVCGNLERCVEILITERIGSRSAPQVTPFLRAYFKRGTNYDCETILHLLYRFDPEWGRTFDAYIKKNSQITESVSSCYAVRNSVAHGGGQSLAPRSLRQYLDASFTLVADLEQMIR
jgi:RiboL-PSP-HEPN